MSILFEVGLILLLSLHSYAGIDRDGMSPAPRYLDQFAIGNHYKMF